MRNFEIKNGAQQSCVKKETIKEKRNNNKINLRFSIKDPGTARPTL